ncbi:MAG: hypothetical protein ABR583_00305 [Gaiellaceae bacterium]
MTARAADEPIVIGVEGKADEPFGDRLEDHVRNALRTTPASGTPQRVDQLTIAFFGSTLATDRSLGAIRYQLLSALAGTLVDARELEATEAILPIHEFRTDKTDDHLQDANAADLDAFLGRLHPGADRSSHETAWISDAVIVRGDGTWLPAERPVRVGKLHTDVRTPA